MESRTSEFIGVLRGSVTKILYTCATIFIDHHSGLSYVHLQYSITVEDTITAKRSFEAYARSHGVSIKHYHTDNGRFAYRKFLEAVESDNQTINYCAASIHHQYGIAKK